MRNKGFTMIELLVVMAIVGLLMTMGLSSYSRSLSRGRDAKRIQDMKEIQKGFELYYSTQSEYADTCDAMFGDTKMFPQGKPMPPAGSLIYDGTCSVTDYTYCAGLENGESYGNAVCPDTGCVFTTSEPTHYCVTNAQ